jgi:RND family efflux transporter MFP subunit
MKYLTIVTLLLMLGGCNSKQNSHGHTHDVVGANAEAEHSHGDETGTLSYTLFSDSLELFVEFPALVAGQTSAFAAHFTNLATYRPLTSGKLTVSLIQGSKGLRSSVEGPASPGIFRPALQPKEAGKGSLIFEMETEKGKTTFNTGELEVFANADEAAKMAVEPATGDEITFLKEQAWKTDFATSEIVPESFHSVIHTSATVKNQPEGEFSVSSQVGGNVRISVVPGQAVTKGELLAFVTGSGVDGNFTVRMEQMRIDFEKSKADYLRVKPLAEKQVVASRDFLAVKNRYLQDSVSFFQLANTVSANGFKIVSPASGFLTAVNVTNGQYIGAGQSVVTVSKQEQLLLEAYINQSDFAKAGGIFDANFKTSEGSTFSMSDLNGTVKSKSAVLASNSARFPVLFSVNNNGILASGMFLEAFLLTGKKENAIVVPLAALTEEQGFYYVYVQTSGESFVKRQVVPGTNDGFRAEITNGLSVGERIVTKGAFQVKLAAMAGELPLHGHTH